MKPIDALIELLDRVGASPDAAALVIDEELHQWPSEAVKAMKSQRLVTKGTSGGQRYLPWLRATVRDAGAYPTHCSRQQGVVYRLRQTQ